jgi:hypothetical protein
MTVSLIRLDQQHSPDVFDDTKSAASIALAETASVDYADFQEYVLSQLKRIIHGDDAGNWHDDIATVFTTPHSLKALGQHTTLDDKQIVLWKMSRRRTARFRRNLRARLARIRSRRSPGKMR